VFDIDTPNHVTWDEYYPVDDFLKWFHFDLGKIIPWVLNYHALYTTKNGMRLIYALSEALPVDKAELRHIYLNNNLIQNGLTTADPTSSQWTRCFRLPRVLRDGLRSDQDKNFRIYVNPDHYLDTSQIPSATDPYTTNIYSTIKPFTETKPDRQHAIDMSYQTNKHTGVKERPEWYKSAKKKLKKAKCYDPLFLDTPLAEKGHRNTTLLSSVGEAISILYPYNNCSPAHIFSLFLPVIDALEPDSASPDWSDILWRMIGDCWQKEEAKQRNREVAITKDQALEQERIDSIVSGVQEWCNSPELWSNEAISFVSKRLIAVQGTTCYVMTRSGRYDSLGVPFSSLVARIRHLGMEDMIKTRTINSQGKEKAIPSQELVNNHGIVVSAIEGRPCIEGGYLEPRGNESALIIPTYRRRKDIPAKFSADVDAWLRKLAGTRYLDLNEWIAWALAFEQGSICALSISGSPGVGKKLLLQGLAETLETCEIATAEDMTGTFNYGLFRTPFLNVDEGWPSSLGRSDPADAFRHLVTGQPVMVNRKHLAPIKVFNPARVILTANDLGIIRRLGEGKNLTPEALQGLAQRIRHIKVGMDAMIWLSERGGMRFTGRPGARWIQGDTGEPSDHILASHFLYLYNRRGERSPGTRLLVDGDITGGILDELRFGSGITSIVIEALVQMAESNRLHHDGLDVWVTVAMIMDYIRKYELMGKHDRALNENSIKSSLRTISKEEPLEVLLKNGIRGLWWKLDTGLLYSAAQRTGKRAPILEAWAGAELVRGKHAGAN